MMLLRYKCAKAEKTWDNPLRLLTETTADHRMMRCEPAIANERLDTGTCLVMAGGAR